MLFAPFAWALSATRRYHFAPYRARAALLRRAFYARLAGYASLSVATFLRTVPDVNEHLLVFCM